MKKQIFVLAGLAAILASPVTALADTSDPTAGVKTDIATLLSIAKTQHDLLIGDLQSIAGSTDPAAALATFQSDRQNAVALLEAQRDQIKTDLSDLRSQKVAPGDLRSILQQASTALQAERQDVQAAVAAARTANQQAKQAARQAKVTAAQASRQAAQTAAQAARQAKVQAQQAAAQAALQAKQAANQAALQAKQAADQAALQAKQTAAAGRLSTQPDMAP